MALSKKQPGSLKHPDTEKSESVVKKSGQQKRFNFLMDADELTAARTKALNEGKPLAKIARELLRNWTKS